MGIELGGYDAGMPISVVSWQRLPGLSSLKVLQGLSEILKTPAHIVRGCFFVALTGYTACHNNVPKLLRQITSNNRSNLQKSVSKEHQCQNIKIRLYG